MHMLTFPVLALIAAVTSHGNAAPTNSMDDLPIDAVLCKAGGYKHPMIKEDGGKEFVPYQIRSDDGIGVLTEIDVMVPDGARGKRASVESYELWENATIPYQIISNLTSSEVSVIKSAIEEYSKYTCIRWVEQTSEAHYVKIQSDAVGCWSYVGNKASMMTTQTLNLRNTGCFSKRTVVHEMMHTAGCYHEQTRPDRDNYVKIHTENVKEDEAINFEINFCSLSHNIEYSYESLMHYGQFSFSINGERTITTLDPEYQDAIGMAPTLSYADIKLLNTIYNCSSINNCSSVPCPNGYVGPDCICYCPSTDANDPVIPCPEISCSEVNTVCGCTQHTDCDGIANTTCIAKACQCVHGYSFNKLSRKCLKSESANANDAMISIYLSILVLPFTLNLNGM